MSLLPPSNNFIFKALLVKNEALVLDILNSFPEFEGDRKILSIKILNPELPKTTDREKASILDIRAKDEGGREFLIEMQGSPHPFFPERLLFYWSKVYGAGIQKGMKYSGLSRVYSITFLNASLFQNTEDFHTTFLLLDKKTGKILLTDHLEMHILELEKVGKHLSKLETKLESWAYFFREVHNLKEEPLQELRSKNPMIEKAIEELEYLSQDDKTRQLYEEQLKAEFDYNSGIYAAFRDGEIKGKLEGRLEGKLEGEIETKLQTARKMREEGFQDDQIMRITGLSESQLREHGIL
jgi:predicted transposase/invertase (TIGR01784 family)